MEPDSLSIFNPTLSSMIVRCFDTSKLLGIYKIRLKNARIYFYDFAKIIDEIITANKPFCTTYQIQ